MAKVLFEGDHIAIRVSWLERLMLAEKPRRVPLASIRGVDPQPRLVDLLVHWADQSALWLGGVIPYDGHLIPSVRNPSNTLAIETEEDEKIFVELDDEPPQKVAARIEQAMRAQSGLPPAPETNEVPSRPSEAQIQLAKLVAEAQARDAEADADEDDEEPQDREERRELEPAQSSELVHQRDLTRLGGWLLGLGVLSALTGTTIVVAGLMPGLFAVGAGLACAVLGGVALLVVAKRE